MELKHYTLSQLLTAYSRDHMIRVSVEHAGSLDRYNIELDHEKSVQVREVGYRVGRLISPPSYAEIVAKRLYKMRFVEGVNITGQALTFEAAIRDTKITVIVQDPKITATEPEISPCVSLDLSKKEEAPVIAISVAEPIASANEDQPKEDLKSYSLEDIISPYGAGYLQPSFELRVNFSRLEERVGVEKFGFTCSPNMERVIQDLVLLKTSASNEMTSVFNDIKGLKFVSVPTRVDEISSFIATKGATTIRVAVLKVKESHAPEPVEQAPKTMKETFISWLQKILS